MEEVDLPSTPHKAVLEPRFLPGQALRLRRKKNTTNANIFWALLRMSVHGRSSTNRKALCGFHAKILLKGEKQEAMILLAHLPLLMSGLEIQAGAYESTRMPLEG